MDLWSGCNPLYYSELIGVIMKNKISIQAKSILLISLCAALFQSATLHAQVPAQSPLLSKSGGGVAPNIMLTLDDSGSMAFRHMPETVFSSDTYATDNPVGSRTVIWDRADGYQTGVNFVGTVAGNFATANYVQRALRSSDTNSVYYNPENRYFPWATSDGLTRLPDSPPNAAYLDPTIRTGAAGTTINLTATNLVRAGGIYNAPEIVVGAFYTIVTRGTSNFALHGARNNNVGTTFRATSVGLGSGTVRVTFCFANPDNIAGVGTGAGQGCEAPVNAFTHDPGVYYRLQKTAAGAYKALTVAANYDAYTINSAAGTKYPRYPKRTDCSTTDLVNGVATKCSQTEERQNFANWYTYYRTRNLLARGAMMEAFWQAGNTFRLGWGTINSENNTIDGVNTNVIQSGVREFNSGAGSTKARLFTWLTALPANGGTPLPRAMAAVGEYYKRTDKQGPYTDNPSVDTNTVADNKSCRRSYHILATDGYWTSAPATAGNSDNTDGATIRGTGKEFTYKASRPFSDSSSDTLADYAMEYWKNDLQPAIANNVAPVADDISFWQGMTNFTVGLGVRGQLNPDRDLPALISGAKSWPAAGPTATTANVDDLWHAAVNSRGRYFSAKDPSELAEAIRTSLTLAAGGTGATAGVATASTVLDSSNRKYVPSYVAGEWSGDIDARPLDSNGQASSSVWRASEVWPVKPTANGGTLSDWDKRKIFTWDTGLTTPAAVPFEWSRLSTSNRDAMGATAATHEADFVNFIRGDHSKEGVGNPFRLRQTGNGASFVLGDFVNSNPVLIQKAVDSDYGRLSTGGTYYQKFLNYKAARQGVLFVGGNAGMLHGFKDAKSVAAGSTDGQEVFAYVPRAVYPQLEKLTNKNYGGVTLPHQYYVDGWQREADAYTYGPSTYSFGSGAGALVCNVANKCWRNYLVGSLGAGGRAVYGLDVTETVDSFGVNKLGASTIRWEFSSNDDSDIGYVMSPIEVGVTPAGKWIAIFGNGQSSESGKAVLFLVDLDTRVLSKVVIDASGSNGLSGVALQKNSAGEIVKIYAGDLKGNMWRLDYSATSSSFEVWKQSNVATAVFKANSGQPITQAPVLYPHSNGGTLLVFGTGRLSFASDSSDTSTQTIYGVWDKDGDTQVGRAITRSSLTRRQISVVSSTAGTFYSVSGSVVDWVNSRGWYVDLEIPSPHGVPGLRVIYPPQFLSYETALISAVAPAQSATICGSNSGEGISFVLSVEQGGNPPFKLFDTNADGVVNSSDTNVSGYKTGADGIDSIVYSPARTGSNSAPDGMCAAGYYRVSIQNTTGQTMTCIRRAPDVAGLMKDRVQRRIINPPIR